VKTINKYLIRKSRLEASKDLEKIMYKLATTNQRNFTHPRVRSAYRSLITNLPYLFTYKNLRNITIHNTTNSIDDGVFSPMKKLIKIHNGFTKSWLMIILLVVIKNDKLDHLIFH